MEYRKATTSDIEQFVEHRMKFVTSVRDVDDIENFETNTKRYLENHIDKDDLIIYLAVDDDKIISSCMACIYQMIPLPSSPNGTIAELLNVFTEEEYRRSGHAEKLISQLIEEVKQQGVTKMILEYISDGFLLYEKLGFEMLEKQMQLKIAGIKPPSS